MFGNVIRLNPFGLVVLLGLTFFCLYMYMDGTFFANKPNDVDNETVDLNRLLAIGIELTESGGRQVFRVRQNASALHARSKGLTKEGANDPLTDGDVKSHRIMSAIFKSNFPRLKLISEEKDDSKKIDLSNIRKSIWTPKSDDVTVKVPVDDVTVWIDPLDATQEYTENLTDYVTVMFCVAVKGKPVIGVIHSPFLNRTVWGWVGHGVRNSNLAHRSKQNGVVKLIVSRSHGGRVGVKAKESFGDLVQIIAAGGAGYKSLQVLSGNATAYVHVTHIKKWDTCAGDAILNAAGGRMSTLGGDDIRYGSADDVLNQDGVLATMFEHEHYLMKLKNVKSS